MSAQEFQWSVKNGDLDAVSAVCPSKFSANEELSAGRYPIHYAADMGQLEVLQYLVKSGADVNKADVHGITPLLAAIWEGHKSCVEYLLQAGADKSGKAPDGKSYLESAESADIKALLK